MAGQIPLMKPTALIVVMAFDRDEEGELRPAFKPREMQTEERAVRTAKEMATRHAGVIAWARSARPDEGEFGEPVVLFRHGSVPDLD
jgi:hypothetical protein